MEAVTDVKALAALQASLFEATTTDSAILPSASALEKGSASLHHGLPDYGIGTDSTKTHLLRDIIPALNRSTLSSRYYGFVTGGITSAARLGDIVVSTFDQNPQVHLPDQTIASEVEAKALILLLELLRFEPRKWTGVFTTGATASNVLGLALARESVINRAVERARGQGDEDLTVGHCGLLRASQLAGIKDVTIFTTKPHSSLLKAASIVGFGRGNVLDVGFNDGGIAFDLSKLESEMIIRHGDHALIVAVSCGEVNTGLFATKSSESMENLRILCDRYDAWLHVDGAFGVFTRLLEGISEFQQVAAGAAGLEMADSIAGDGHKMLNVPYDCGFFFHCRPGLAEQVFQNTNAAYLNTNTTSSETIRSTLNIGIENSRRFRGLPVYTTLVSYGRTGYQDMLQRQIRLARAIACFIFDHPDFELLPLNAYPDKASVERDIFIIVLFRATQPMLNTELVGLINKTSAIYVSGTTWDGGKATRFAIANWQARLERDLPIIIRTLSQVVVDWKESQEPRTE